MTIRRRIIAIALTIAGAAAIYCFGYSHEFKWYEAVLFISIVLSGLWSAWSDRALRDQTRLNATSLLIVTYFVVTSWRKDGLTSPFTIVAILLLAVCVPVVLKAAMSGFFKTKT